MGERAITIERVSTRRQTPGLQSPELAARLNARGYEHQRNFRLSVSARKGKQQAVLDEILAGARRGDWTVVLCVALDRIERRGPFALNGWLVDLYRAGARVESTSPGEEWLSNTSDEAWWLMRLAMEADRAKREAQLRAERTARGHHQLDQQGMGRVKLPLGWRYDRRDKFDHDIVVDAEAMAVVRGVFRMAAGGSTLQALSRHMRAQGYPRTPEAIGMMLRMECYSSGQLYVPVPVDVETAMEPEVQAQAIAALEARRTTTRRSKDYGSTDFSGRVYCYEHGQPLHRWLGPRRVKTNDRERYYRARRRDGGECGCGLFFADHVDSAVEGLLGLNEEPETEMVVTGDNSRRLAQIDQEINHVQKNRRTIDGWVERLAALDAEDKALRESPAGGWERQETGRSLGAAWRSMDRPEQRRYLERQAEQQNWKVLIRKDGGVREVSALLGSGGQRVKGLFEPGGDEAPTDD